MKQAMGKVATVLGCLAMTGCAGLGAPVGRRVPIDHSSAYTTGRIAGYEDFYKDPRKLALWRLAQWDQAISNLQGGNTAANVGLSGLATALGVSAARELSKSTTIGLAAGGLFGMSMSEALVQVSRINVYSAGISGLECAVASYGEPIEPHDEVTNPLRAYKDLADNWQVRYDEIVRIREDARQAMDGGMLLAVSRISRQVDSALMGSFVSANSRGAGWTSTFSAAVRSGQDSSAGITGMPIPDGTQYIKIVGTPGDLPLVTQDRAKLNAELAMDKALAEAKAFSRTVEQRRARMDACDIDGATSDAERVGVPFGVDLLGAEEPVRIEQGASASFRLFGGVPGYAAGVAGSTTGPEVGVSQGGIALVTVKAEESTPVGQYQVVVADSTGAAAKTVAVEVVEDE